MNVTPALRTARLQLEPVRPAHAAEVWPQLDDGRMWEYFPALRPGSLDDLRRLYAKWERGSADSMEVWCNWLCRELATGEIAGAMQATIVPPQRLSYVAYAIYPAHQRKGYAREAVSAVIGYVRESYAVDRFLAEMDVRNEPSYRLAESLGFKRAETREGEYLYELRL